MSQGDEAQGAAGSITGLSCAGSWVEEPGRVLLRLVPGGVEKQRTLDTGVMPGL